MWLVYGLHKARLDHDASIPLGRGPLLRIKDLRVSRNAALVRGYQGGIQVTAVSTIHYRNHADGPLTQLSPGQTAQLYPGSLLVLAVQPDVVIQVEDRSSTAHQQDVGEGLHQSCIDGLHQHMEFTQTTGTEQYVPIEATQQGFNAGYLDKVDDSHTPRGQAARYANVEQEQRVSPTTSSHVIYATQTPPSQKASRASAPSPVSANEVQQPRTKHALSERPLHISSPLDVRTTVHNHSIAEAVTPTSGDVLWVRERLQGRGSLLPANAEFKTVEPVSKLTSPMPAQPSMAHSKLDSPTGTVTSPNSTTYRQVAELPTSSTKNVSPLNANAQALTGTAQHTFDGSCTVGASQPLFPATLVSRTLPLSMSKDDEGIELTAPAKKRRKTMLPKLDIPSATSEATSVSQPSSYVHTESNKPGIFSGLCILLQPPRHQAQHDILLRKIAAQGGLITTSLTPTTTHIIVQPDITYKELKKLIVDKTDATSKHDGTGAINERERSPKLKEPVQIPEGVKLLCMDYITHCLAQGKLLQESLYTVQPPQPPVSRRGSGNSTLQQAVPEETGAPMAAAGATVAANSVQPTSSIPEPTHPANVADGQSARFPLPSNHKICDDPRHDWGKHDRWCEPYDESAALLTLTKLYRHWMRQDLSDTDMDGLNRIKRVISGEVEPGPSQQGVKSKRPRLSHAQRRIVGAVARRRHDTSSDSDTEDEHGHASDQSVSPWKSSLTGLGFKPVNTVCSHVACMARPVCLIAELQAVADGYSHQGGTAQFRKRAADDANFKLRSAEFPITSRDDLVAIGLPETGETIKKCEEILGTGRLLRNKMQQDSDRHTVVARFVKVWGVGESVALQFYRMGMHTVEEVVHKLEDMGMLESPAGPDVGYESSGSEDNSSGERMTAKREHGPVVAQIGAVKLTEQARVGLKYHADFERRIPRTEMERIERTVYHAVVKVLCEITGLRREVITDPEVALHCRLMGSYQRGAVDSGDADFIICPPFLCEDEKAVKLAGGHAPVRSPCQLLSLLLDELVDQDALTNDMSPTTYKQRHPHCGPHDSVTFLGVWCKGGPAGSPCYRRIDLKVYPRAQLPLAVLYFGSGTTFNRAIRYWANHPRPEVLAAVQKQASGACAWHLSDRELTPVRAPPGKLRVPWRAPQHKEEQPLQSRPGRFAKRPVLHDDAIKVPESAPSILCESDIFTALQLDYVPLHMRGLM